MKTDVEALLISIYYDLKSPLAYTSKRNVYSEAKKHVNIRKKDVYLWFENQFAPTLDKPVMCRFKRNGTSAKGVGEQFQSDLCDMSNISKFNDKYTLLLTSIDCFSRYTWLNPVKNKSGLEIARVLEKISQKLYISDR